jgi:hypothetical protein
MCVAAAVPPALKKVDISSIAKKPYAQSKTRDAFLREGFTIGLKTAKVQFGFEKDSADAKAIGRVGYAAASKFLTDNHLWNKCLPKAAA